MPYGEFLINPNRYSAALLPLAAETITSQTPIQEALDISLRDMVCCQILRRATQISLEEADQKVNRLARHCKVLREIVAEHGTDSRGQD